MQLRVLSSLSNLENDIIPPKKNLARFVKDIAIENNIISNYHQNTYFKKHSISLTILGKVKVSFI